MKVRLTDKWIYICAVINSLLLILLLGVRTHVDSFSYIDAWDNSWSIGIIDDIRTPIYPIIIGIMKYIFNNYFMFAIVVIQHIIFLVSIYYFKKIISWKIKSKTVGQWITLLYVLLPATASWANCIMTELLAFTGVVFLFYNIFAFQQKAQLSNVLWSTLWLAFLIFLRPACLYLFPGVALAWILFYKYNKQYAIWGLIGIFIVGLAELGYCYQFKKKYGIFSPSCVNVLNQSYLAFENGLMDISYTNNTDFQNDITTYNGTPVLTYQFVEKYGLPALQESVALSKRIQYREWFNHTLMGICKNSSAKYLDAYAIPSQNIRHLLALNISYLYIFMFLYFIFLLYFSIKKHKIFKTSTILFITVLANLFLVIIGTTNDWGRLLIPSLPLTLIMIGCIIKYIKIQFDNHSLKLHT